MQTIPIEGWGGAAATATATAAGVCPSPFFKTERTLNKTQRTARKKQHIPQAIKWQTWIRYAGEHFKAKCATPWCSNIMNVTNFQAGHKLAEAAGGQITLDNLVPICASCNQSMGTEHFDTWSRRGAPVKSCCFSFRTIWRALTGQRVAYPRPPTPPRRSSGNNSNNCNNSNNSNKKPITTNPLPSAEPLTPPISYSSPSSPPESDGDTQDDTYHPPPLQPGPPPVQIV